MKIRSLAIVAAAFIVTVLVSPALAMYHPGMGRFMQRDPHGTMNAPTAPRVGMAGPAAIGGFVARDPMPTRPQPGLQYADGMNLYQYVRGNPLSYVDPSGRKLCSPATGSLRTLMEDAAERNTPFTRSGKPDPHKRISFEFLSCLACQESSYNPCAQGTTDDYGLMQLTKKGAIAQCQTLKILSDRIDYSDDHRKNCCSWDKQPPFKRNKDTGKVEREKKCRKGCEDSMWKIENQINCAAAYLRWTRDSQAGTVTLPMMICAYNRGLGAPCNKDDTAKEVPYVKSVMECMANLGRVKPDDPRVVNPPKEAK